jgi:hypothetical protein
MDVRWDNLTLYIKNGKHSEYVLQSGLPIKIRMQIKKIVMEINCVSRFKKQEITD